MTRNNQPDIWDLPIDLRRPDKKISLIFTPLINQLPREVRSQLPKPPYNHSKLLSVIRNLRDSQGQGPAYEPCPHCNQIKCRAPIVFYCGGCSQVVYTRRPILHNWWCSECEWTAQRYRYTSFRELEEKEGLFESSEQSQLAILHGEFHCWVTALEAQLESHIIRIHCKKIFLDAWDIRKKSEK